MHREDKREIGQFHFEVCSSVLKTKDYLGRYMRKVLAGHVFYVSENVQNEGTFKRARETPYR